MRRWLCIPRRGKEKHKNTTPTLEPGSQEIPAWQEIIIGIASCEPANAENKKPRRANCSCRAEMPWLKFPNRIPEGPKRIKSRGAKLNRIQDNIHCNPLFIAMGANCAGWYWLTDANETIMLILSSAHKPKNALSASC